MGHINLNLNDGIDSADAGSAQPTTTPAKKAYTVIAKAGLFKNGQEYKTGDTIELDAKTAANFIAAGDIEDNAN